MLEVLTGLFDPTGFSARKECGTGWTPTLIWMHASSDLFIWLAYVSIPLILLYFTRRRDPGCSCCSRCSSSRAAPPT